LEEEDEEEEEEISPRFYFAGVAATPAHPEMGGPEL